MVKYHSSRVLKYFYSFLSITGWCKMFFKEYINALQHTHLLLSIIEAVNLARFVKSESVTFVFVSTLRIVATQIHASSVASNSSGCFCISFVHLIELDYFYLFRRAWSSSVSFSLCQFLQPPSYLLKY